MSNHPSIHTKRNLLRRTLASLLCLALFLGLLPASVGTAQAHWADSYVRTLVDWGVMRGDVGGNMAPERNITRAEFVTMMNRAYGYTKMAGHPFTDVRSRDWYAEDIDIAYNIGYFKGTSPTTASPNSPLTREQAAVLLARNMMLQPTVGETLGFSDTRSLSDWSRGLVGAAAKDGIISGYENGSFQPQRNITRGEVAAMLVRSIGTPINTPGDHALGNVYGNVTVNTSGVSLRDGVIAGNLYLTGGIDRGSVLLENVTVLGEIIVSGGGESDSSQSSVILRNVAADSMTVDSIGEQFVTIRAEGVTDIPTTTVRTNAYVDDSSLPGYGLSFIQLDGQEGALYQLAGNIKEVINRTPNSDMQIVQGAANKVTVDEDAVGSRVLVDGDARVDDLNLDTATQVTGTGDIDNLNVGAAGSTVAQLPDDITIRPGITADINGGTMNSTQAAESSADPKLLAGYPAVRKIAPNSAELVFRTNKAGTIYWAVSAVADGSVSEADLLEPPVYGNKVLASGNIRATAANTDYTAAVRGLTSAGSYYVTAMLVDGRGEHSPIKVTSFSTPDDTTPAFASGYPVMTRVTTEIAQVTVMTNKSCQLYYALLPAGAGAPKPQEFKSAAISGNLGYGTLDVVKNVTTPINVNRVPLEEKTNYVLYLWLTDHDGSKSSSVVAVRFTTPDETPPVVTSIMQTNATDRAVTVAYTMDEPGSLIWAVVTESEHDAKTFLSWETARENAADTSRGTLTFKDASAELAAKVRLESGVGSTAHGTAPKSPFTIGGLLTSTTNTSSYYLYYMGKDTAGNYSEEIKFLKVNTLDSTPPKFVEQTFTRYIGNDTDRPLANTDIRLVFSENIQGGAAKEKQFKSLYDRVEEARANYAAIWNAGDPPANASPEVLAAKKAFDDAREDLGEALSQHFTMFRHPTAGQDYEVPVRTADNQTGEWTVDWRNARITMEEGRFVLTLPTVAEEAANKDFQQEHYHSALKLDSGATYYFKVQDLYDLAVKPNAMGNQTLPQFTTVDARVLLNDGDEPAIINAKDQAGNALTLTNDQKRIDYHFQMTPQDVERIEDSLYWDMLLWFNANVSFTLYSRPIDDRGQPIGGNDAAWVKERAIGEGNNAAIWDAPVTIGRDSFKSYINLYRTQFNATSPSYERVNTMLTNGSKERREYAIHLDTLEGSPDYTSWTNPNVTLRVSVVAGTRNQLGDIKTGTLTSYENALAKGVRAIETPSPYTYTKAFNDQRLPSIQPGTPNITSRSDVSATITMRLDRPGKVHYLVLPLSEIRDPDATGSAIRYLGDNEIMETQLLRVQAERGFSTPIPLLNTAGALPSLAQIPLMEGDTKAISGSLVGGGLEISQPNFTQFTSQDVGTYERLGIIKGVTATANTTGELLTINLTKQLKANTVYALCLLPSGISTVPDNNSKITCYRFTTNMMEIPKLLLTGTNNPTIQASEMSGGTALMEYFVVRQGKEDLGGSQEFHATFGTGANGLAKDSFANILRDYPNVRTKPNTVLEAMATPCYQGSTFVGTAFDIYAKDEIKSTYADRIRSTSNIQGGNDDVVWGEGGTRARRLDPTADLLLGDHIEAGQDFTIVAMARRDTTTNDYAFCAWYPVHKRATTPPMVNSVTVSGVTQAKNADGTKNIGVKSGTVIVQFNGSLYNWVGNTAYPIDNCAMGVHVPNPTDKTTTNSTQYYTLGNAVTGTSPFITLDCDDKHPSSPSAISMITLNIKDLEGNTSDSITFGRYKITTSTGNGSDPNRNSLVITVKAVRTNADPDNPIWGLEVVVNRDWDNT